MLQRVTAPTIALAGLLAASLAADAAAPPSDRRSITTGAVATGVTKPGRDITMSVPIDGVVSEIHVKEGQTVRAGDLLAVMDHRVAVASVRAAEAEAERTAAIDQAAHDVAFQTWLVERLEAASAVAGANDYQLREAQFTLELRKAAHASAIEDQTDARRRLDLARARLDEHFIRAPFDGAVISVDAGAGETLNTSDALLRLVNLDELEAELYLPAAVYPQLAVDQGVTVNAAPPVDRPLDARLVFIDPVIDPGTQQVRCVFSIDNRGRTLPAGFTVRLPHDAIAPDRAAVADGP